MDIDVSTNCTSSKMELDQKIKDMEQIGQKHVAAFLTLKQKILSTETLIRDYQTAKLECELQTRKVEELSRSINCLREDLSYRTAEYSKMLTAFEPMKEENERYATEVNKLETELFKWKSDAGGAQSLIDQLTERVKQLEKLEKEKDVYSTMAKEHGKIKEKLETLNSQCKEAKERHNEAKKELKQSQKAYQKLLKSALLWGRLADSKGLLNSAHKRTYVNLTAEHPDVVALLPAPEFTVDDPKTQSHAEQISDALRSDDERKQPKIQTAPDDIFKVPQVPDLDIKATTKLGRGARSLDFQDPLADFKVPAERLRPTESVFDNSLPDLEATDSGGMPELQGDGPWGNRESFVQHSKHSFPTVTEKGPVEAMETDDELEKILQIVKKDLPSNLTALSPLPLSPEMEMPSKPLIERSVSSIQDTPAEIKPAVPEVKSLFPSLPRCAFNWTAKKLPISDKLGEKFGISLHAGRKIRIRYRRVGSVTGSERSRDSLCRNYLSVVNFAEAEKPPPLVQESFFVVEEADKEPELKETRVPSSHHVAESPATNRPMLMDPFNTRNRQERLVEAPVVSHCRANQTSLPAHLPRKVIETKVNGKMPSVLAKEKSVHKMQRAPSSIPAKPPEHGVQSALATSKRKQLTRENLFGDFSDDESNVALESSVLSRPPRSDEDMENRSIGLQESPSPYSAPKFGLQPSRLVKPVIIRPISCKAIKPPVQPSAEWDGLVKSKTVTRMVAPVKRALEAKALAPEIPAEPSELHVVSETASSAKKRIAHTTKRELSASDSSPPSPVKKKPKAEDAPAAQSPMRAAESLATSTICATTETNPKNDTSQEMEVKLPPSTAFAAEQIKEPELSQAIASEVDEANEMAISQPIEFHSETTSETMKCPVKEMEQEEPPSDTDTVEITTHSPAAQISEVLDTSEKMEQESLSGKGIAEDISRTIEVSSKTTETNVEVTEEELSTEECDVGDSPQSPPVENTPEAMETRDEKDQEPPTEQFSIEDTPQSPVANEIPLELSDIEDAENRLPPGRFQAVRAIPTSPVKQSASVASAYEIVMQLSTNQATSASLRKPSKKMKKEAHLFVNRFLKGDADSFSSCLTTAVEKLTRPGIAENPSTLIRHLISMIVKDCSSPLDTTFTPPAPPLTTTQQRCIVFLRTADEKHRESSLKPSSQQPRDSFTDSFLDEICAVLFKRGSTFSLEEKSSLARVYIAICRLRGHLNRARTFLYDCLYFYPAESYALTYTIVSVWAEVLRHVTYPTGLSAMDQSVVYLLTKCTKIRAVPGLPGKVLQVRSFIQSTYGYKSTESESSETINGLLSHLIKKLKDARSVDECSSLSWNLALLAHWEGNDWGLSVIKEHLWPLLQCWSLGEGTDASAIGAIRGIGLIGRRLPDKQRQEIKGILEVLKNQLLESNEVSPLVQEAAIEVILLLGPETVISVLKAWKPRAPLTVHLKRVLDSFIHQRAKPSINSEQDCEPSHCVNSFVDK